MMVEDEKVMMEEKKEETGTVSAESSAGAGENVDSADAATAADEAVGVESVPESTQEGSATENPEPLSGPSGESPGQGEGQETFGDADILSGEADDAAHQGDAIVQGLRQQVEALGGELEEKSGQYKRIAADFENFRRRTQKEKADIEIQIKCNTITQLLPVIDNFERARAQIKPQTDAEMNIHKSYQSVYKQLVDCLKQLGVSPMRSEGELFDPNLHDAVMREPTDEYDEGVVMEDLMRGYMLGDRVLRHAMVKVAAAAEPSSDVEDQPEGSAEANDA